MKALWKPLQYVFLCSLPLAVWAPAAWAGFSHATPADPTRLLWRSPAEWQRGLRKTRGTLQIGGGGVAFRAAKGRQLGWSFENIKTFDLSPHRLVIAGYANRKWRLPGDRNFHFQLKDSVPPAVAAEFARRVGKPNENGVPDPNAPAFAVIPARHRTRGGGTNGVLRFRRSGIDYVTASGRGARSWRWADIQTIARPDPYHFRVGAYREIFEFELKRPMSERLFDRLWNFVYARHLHGLNLTGGTRP
jgi:hypothetical protein